MERTREKTIAEVANKKITLIAHCIFISSVALRDFRNCSEFIESPVPLYVGIEVSPITGCPVEEKYAKGKKITDEQSLPPFFPGDRTGIRGIRKARPRSPND